MTVKYEVITLVVATETWGDVDTKKGRALREGLAGLDHIVPILDKHMGSMCKVIDYSAEDYVLVPRMKEEEAEEEEEGDLGILPVGMAELLIEELKLPSRVQNSLRRGNFTTIGEVLDHSSEELLALRLFGDRALQELFAKLNQLGLSIGRSGMYRGWRNKKLIDLVEPNEEDTGKEDGSNIEEIAEVPSTVYSTGADTSDSDIDISQFATRAFAPDDEEEW